ncbi:MAG: ATP-binding cassette domain-containing protein, partial [Cyclobacteriaceae bacterium]|nr:ATP-binding cassette domain-containing protein [Cyclobacteriaceae bacterium]
MSEEILKALTQLFAIVTKQDSGVSEKEREYVINFFRTELDQDSVYVYLRQYDEQSEYSPAADVEVKRSTSVNVRESIRILGICKKINKTLTQKQKVIVLIKLIELVSADNNFTPQRLQIIHTVATVFNIGQEEYNLIESFVVSEEPHTLDFDDVLLANGDAQVKTSRYYRHIHAHLEGVLAFMRVKSVELFFVKYLGPETITLNSFSMKPGHVYLFSHGSTVKTPAGSIIYYSDLLADFTEEIKTTRLSFHATIDELRFSNGTVGLRNIRIEEGPGKLIGIMGASGAGKTTLLNVLAGLTKPTRGKILINGYDIFREKDRLKGVIGYVAQEDMLIDELTVYQNLYYNARLCLAHLSEAEIHQRVMTVLESLGLDQRKNLHVGSLLDKIISGGQRKRLNIALELIREPAVLFLDEPTSGLSSRDSENVLDLLKELSLKGKLLFVVIHQPSSDLYKMFDKIFILDTGGYPVYYGNPVEAITYFKRLTLQVDSHRGQCEVCGNVNPEQIFNIMEANVVDEYGQPTTRRKITPQQWHQQFLEGFRLTTVDVIREQPPQSLNIPGRIRQSVIFAIRDLRAKLINKQYLLINLLEAPLLAFILAFVIRYRSAPGGKEYLFRFEDNFPAFILISIIVALFMGLTVSAEEIIRDRKILRRESFLDLSWNSYLVSKLTILFTLSAIQTLTFVLVGNLLLELEWRMILPYWFILFTVSCLSNVLGLNISSAFNSAVTIYVLIPLLLIPQMILSGLL